VGTKKGFLIYNTYPFCNACVGSIDTPLSYIQIHYRSNIFILLGDPDNPKIPPK
jgi:hypothetical protein